jgi:hypothetical protein
VTAERTSEAKRRAIAEGRPTFANIPPGLRQRNDGRLEPHPKQATIIRDAFDLRASGSTVREVREFLRRNGIKRSYHGVQAILTSRMYLGELRFGELINTDSHPAIVDLATWQRVQKMRSPRGRRPTSDRLLARLGVLRCATCGARMVTGSSDQNGKRHYMYRCPPIGDCTRRSAISAPLVEEKIENVMRAWLAGGRGAASVTDGIAEAEHELSVRKQELAAAVQAFSGLDDVEEANERLRELRDQRDLAQQRVEQLRAAAAPTIAARSRPVSGWDDLDLDEKRALIQAVIERATVAPGRGSGRVTVELFEQ